MDLETVRARAGAALQNLEANRARINGLNVYPVPDGDTGTNLTLTLRAIVAALDASSASGPDAVAHELSRAALMGARGNSGVILSQIVRGAASVLGEQDGTDAPLIARALRAASDEAYRATLRPVEGTMLTVIREMAEEAERRSSAGPLTREELLEAVVAHGEDTLRRTPEMLPKLKEAGVVDAGGAGLVEIMRGVHLSAAGLPLPEVSADEEAQAPPLDHEFSEFAFCTNFVIEGEGLDRDAVAESLGVLGDSLHVVGDSSLLRVHVHTDDPAAAVAVAERHGTVVQSTFDAADMHEQVREQLLLSGKLVTAIVAVAAGEGNRRTFERVFGEVRVVSGGASANPSVQELADAVNETLAREVVLLPNDGNVLKAAIQATEFATKPVRVVPSRSVQAGIHLVNGPYRHEVSADVNVDDMTRDLESVLAGEVTRASRTVVQDGVDVTEGDWLGLLDERVVASGASFDEVALAVAEEMLREGEGPDAIDLILGEGSPRLDVFRARLASSPSAPEGLQIFTRDGGQPHYPLLLLAERGASEHGSVHVPAAAGLPVTAGGARSAVGAAPSPRLPGRPASAAASSTATVVASAVTAEGLLRVLLVEDSEVFGETFRATQDRRNGITVVGLLPDGEAALGAVAELAPDVVVVDVRLPGMSGADLVRRLRASYPTLPVVCITGDPEGAAVDDVLTAGAVGVIVKGTPNDDVARTLLTAAGRTLLTRANTAIVLDSTSDYREEDARARYANIRVVPLGITFETETGEESFRDHLDIHGHDFYERLRQGPAKTNAPFPGDYEAVYGELLRDYERIYSLHLSEKLSATFTNARLQALEMAPDRIRVVDAETASLAVALLAQAIERRLARGTTDVELECLIERFKETNGVVFTVGTLEYLRRGGRIGGAQALMGSLLSVKPILSVADGVINPIGRVRGRKKALAEFARVFRETTDDGPGLRIAIAHADAPEWIDDIKALVETERPHADPDVLVAELGAAVGTHAGPGSVGFFWFFDPTL